ncbi:uncharacterized protein LOC135806312 [Sycon ciliatum]|uniref:uncharacterized protein LOC135806312 n=1 Tax=Sycon ciliatum TaxID=27933 RepID=UPI0020AD1082
MAATDSDKVEHVLPGMALPPDMPHTQDNIESFQIMSNEDARKELEHRSKSPVVDIEDFDESPPVTPVMRSGAASAATLQWDPYDSRLATPSPGDQPAQEQQEQQQQQQSNKETYSTLPLRRSSTPPVPAWAVKESGDGDVVIVEGLDDVGSSREGSPDFMAKLRSSSPNFFATSTPLKGISPGRPKPGSLRGMLSKRRARVAPMSPSPLVMENAGAGEGMAGQEDLDTGKERPLYSQVHRQSKPDSNATPAAAQGMDDTDAISPSLPRKTSSSKVLEETLAGIAPPCSSPPLNARRHPSVGGDARDRTASTDSSEQMNETSPYAEVQYQNYAIQHDGTHAVKPGAHMPCTPPTRRESMPVPTTAKSVTFRQVTGNDYLLAADAATNQATATDGDLLDNSAGDWIEDPTHLTPLHYAAALGKRRYLTLLLKQLKRGVIGERTLARLDDMQETTMMRTTNASMMTDMDCYDGHQRTALMHAVHGGHMDCVRLLLHEGASVDARSNDGSTALHVSCFDGDASMASLLLHHGADPCLMDTAGRLPLHWATAPYGRVCVHVLMKKAPEMNVNALDASSMTPLMWAAYHDSPDVMEELLQHGADRTLQDEDGMSACHWAVHPQHDHALKILLDTNSVRTRDARGKTLAHMSAEHGAVECMKLVLSNWPQSIHQCDDNGRTPLHWATVCEQPNIIRLLLVAGADPSAPDRLGRSARDYAAIKKLRYCQILLSRPKFAASHEMSMAQLDASITGEFNERWSQWLSDGCVLGKYTHDGRGPLHKRFFWVDISHNEICWSKDKKKLKEYSSAKVIDIVPGASEAVLARADYSDRKRHHFTVLTTDRSLDVVSSNADDFQCWLQGLRCLIQMKTAAGEG